MFAFGQATPWFAPAKIPQDQIEDIKNYIIALLEGLDIAAAIHPSKECVAASDDALTYAAAGIDNYYQQNIWEGTLNISDSLGALSPLARQCDKSIENLAKIIERYPKQFQSVTDFLIKFSLNALGNLKPLLDRYLFVKHYAGDGNTTAVVQTVGEIIKIHFSISSVIKNPFMTDENIKPLNYTWADPLAPNPVPSSIWNVFESTYNFLIDSKFISQKNLVECEGGALNMLLYNIDASNNFKASNSKEGVFSVLDSFQFLHQSIEGCTYTLIEMGERSNLIDKEVFNNPAVIWKNIVSNIFEILSDGLFGYSEYFHQDVISFFSAVGDFFYRTITYRVDNP
jgi:hypothetical protein